MTQPAKAQEPSMEEILASIRRIIADDDANKGPPRAAEPPKAAPRPVPPPPEPKEPEIPAPDPLDTAVLGGSDVQEQTSDILDLTESMEAPSFSEPEPQEPTPTPQFRKIEGVSDVSFDEMAQRPPAARSDDRSQLLSASTSAAVDSAFNSLAQTVLVQNARTLEDLVREMLRPMLKSWLDDNLPSMVERLVRAEIERVARGR
jgi:uncharacterized protein